VRRWRRLDGDELNKAGRYIAAAMDPKVKEFLRYVLSQEGQADVMRDGQYLPLTADVVREQLKKLE
jgi:ABC-type Fe3+ transport system substrate-binding protein